MCLNFKHFHFLCISFCTVTTLLSCSSKVSQQGHLSGISSPSHYPPSVVINNGNISINQHISDCSLKINSENVCIPAHPFFRLKKNGLNIPQRKFRWYITEVSLMNMYQENKVMHLWRKNTNLCTKVNESADT